MERNFNEDRRFKLYGDKLFSIHASNNLIIETSYNNIDFCSNAVIFDGHVELNRVICNNISISNVSEISSNFVYVNNIDLPSNNKLKYNSVNNGYIRNTSIGIDNTSYTIGRSDAYFTYINVSGGDASFNTNLTINKDLRIDGTLTISNDLLINGNNFASIENSFNIYRAALEQNFYSAKIVTNDLSASAISISNNLVALKTAYFNDISINGQLLNNVLKVPALFTIDPSGHGNASGTLIINGDLTVNGLQTSIASSVVDICDQAITLASNLALANIQDLSSTNAGLDISNIASLKYNGTLWNFGGGQLSVQNNKVLLNDDLSLAKRDFDLSINEFKEDFSSSFFALKRNIDNSYNATYSRSQITNKFILKSNFDISSTSLLSYVDSSYISKSTFTISYGDILTLMDTSYVEQRRVGIDEPQYDYSSSTITPFGQNISGETTFNYFGYSVALSEDGKIMGVTAPLNNGAGTVRGSARIYKYNDISWVQLGQDIDGETDNGNQTIINLSEDGTIAAISSHYNSNNRGIVRIFKYTNDTSWVQQGLDISGSEEGDKLGYSISLSGNGKIIVIGAPENDSSYNNAGQVCVYSYIENINSWNMIGTFNGFDVDCKTGTSVSLSSSGTILAISSPFPNNETDFSQIPRVDIYELSNNIWSPKGPTIYGSYFGRNSKFGNNIVLSRDGLVLAINELYNPSNNNLGRVLVYNYNSTDNSWNKLGSDINIVIDSSNSDWDDPYIALSSDGTIMALGMAHTNSSDRGLVRLYKLINSEWIKVGPELLGNISEGLFGFGISLSGNGNVLAIGSPKEDPDFTGFVRTYNINHVYTVTYPNPFDNSFQTFNDKLDISYLLNSVFEASHNKIKTDFDISFATINANNITTSASSITIENINTKHSSQRFANSLWNQIGQDISNESAYGVVNKNNKIVISNDGRVIAYSKPYTTLTATEIESAVTTWSYRSVEINDRRSICWSPELGLFVAVSGSGNNRVITSYDGINWTARTAATASIWYGVCWSKELELFVAVSRGIQVMTSVDGITWISRTPANGAGRAVCWSAELRLFVAVSDNNVARSSDGITWVSAVGIPQGEWVSVCWSPQRRLFVAGSVNFARLMTSSDGINWTPITVGTPTTGQWASICWSPEKLLFVAVGFGSTTVMTSPDGIAWTPRTHAGTYNWMSVCWSRELGLFVAVGNLYGTNNRVMTSYNGTDWVARTGGGTDWWYGVCWSGELGIFAAVGSGGTNGVMISSVASTTYAGIVYVYEVSYNNWDRLGNNTIVGLSGDELGYSLALSSNGRIVAASSIYKNASAGQVRVYELSNNTNSWTQKGSAINGPRPGSESGYSISLAGNGNRIAIGAWKDNSNGTNAGAVRVYDFSNISNVAEWRQQGQTITGVSGSFEGYSTALSLDGQTLASGSIVEPSTNIITVGPVKTFIISGNTWINKGIIQGPQIYLTDISYSISNTLIPSQGQVLGEPFTFSGTTYSNTDGNGYGSALNSDGTIFAISSNSSPALGCIRVYKFNGLSWQLMGPIIYGTATNNIIVYYTLGLSLSHDGRTLSIHVSGSSTSFAIYKYNDISWNNTGYFNNERAVYEANALSGDGNTFALANSIANAGTIFVWKYINNVWTSIASINNTSTSIYGSNFPSGIALSYDGNTLVGSNRNYPSGANQQGVALIFKYNNSTWQQLGPSIYGPIPIQEFGYTQPSISSDGLTVLIGGYKEGRVFKYSAIDVSWQYLGPILNGAPISGYDQFNGRMSSDGTIVTSWYSGKASIWKYRLGSWIKIFESTNLGLLIGNALSADGTVYVNCYSSPTFIKINKLTTTTTNIINENLLYASNKAKYLNLFFGRDIKLSSNGNNIVIGATGPTINGLDLTFNTSYPYNQGYRLNQGSIYTYEYAGSGTTWRQLGQVIHGISGGDEFGSSVSMSNDGTLISVGSNNNNYNRGYVRVFAYVNNYWYQLSNSINGKISSSKAGIHALSGDGRTLIQTNNTYNSVYGLNRSLAFIPSTTTISTTISGDLAVTGKAYLKSFRISNKHNFDVSINGYSSHYLATTDISASIVDYYSNVGYIYNKVFNIDACGNVSNYSGLYGAVSDSRLKENIVNCAPKLADLLKVRVVNYNLKGSDKTKYIGVLAQELEELFPELVVEDNTVERIKSVNYSNLTIMLIKAFQEQQVLINNLYASLKDLEN